MLFRNQWCAFKTVCRAISGYDPYTSYHFILPDFEYFKWSLIILVSNIWEEEIRKGLREWEFGCFGKEIGRMLIMMKIFDFI